MKAILGFSPGSGPFSQTSAVVNKEIKVRSFIVWAVLVHLVVYLLVFLKNHKLHNYGNFKYYI